MFRKTVLSWSLGLTLATSIVFADDVSAFITKYYYDGEQLSNLKAAASLADDYPNSEVYMKYTGYNTTSPYKAVGYIRNTYGWNGGESMGTGTVIDDYTVLTNAHVIDNKNGYATAASHLSFLMNRDGTYIPYRFAIKGVRKVPNSDLALIYTTKRLSAYVKPLTFATETQINSLKTGQPLFSVGYPRFNGRYDRRVWNRILFLRQSSNHNELMLKDMIRAGASGSPLVDSRYRIYGVRTYGERVDGFDENIYAKYEIGGAFALKGKTREYIMQYKQ
ncbi:serine protease [Macrococcus hajekii]|uniref:Serine protease n=1 Tax=Macrococcus hajekii TaxID=198482 RepID=A0A4R6BJ83_9STAP|nr:serine protease [Macrococcus hajekii]TDM01616.1 serine protease [Macrococcus hajekii]GGB01524.1 hypothetical protein GCM10007190_06990 [Macrococcus hajekii]